MPERSITRRGFWTRAASLAAPFVISSSTRRANAYVAPSDRLTVGMIGVGRQTIYSNLKSFLESPETQVVAVCDVDSWRLDRAHKAVEQHYASQKHSGVFKGCSVYTDFRDLLARTDIDAVMISTPDHWHVPMALAAVRAGKHVSCEKPLTRSIFEGRLLSDAVRRYNVVFRTDSEFRSLPNFHRACELVRNGRIGEVRTIHVGVPPEPTGGEPSGAEPMPVAEELDYDMWLGPAPLAPYTEKRVHPHHGYGRPGWMRILDYCDGMITNWGSHLIDIAQWGNNTDRTGPVEVWGQGEYPSSGLWNVLLSFEVQYRYRSGVQLIYKIDNPYVRFVGTQGWIHAQWNEELRAHPESVLTSRIGPEEIHLPLKNEKEDFIEAVKTGGQTLEDAEVGHRITSVCLLGHIAIQLGQKLKWDPEGEQFLNNDSANRLLSSPMREPWGY